MCATWIQVWNILRTCFTAHRSHTPLASVTNWEMGLFPVFVSLVIDFPYFHLGLSVQGPAAWSMVPLIYLCLLKPLKVKAKLPAILSHNYLEGGEPGRCLGRAEAESRGHYLGLHIQWHPEPHLELSFT